MPQKRGFSNPIIPFIGKYQRHRDHRNVCLCRQFKPSYFKRKGPRQCRSSAFRKNNHWKTPLNFLQNLSQYPGPTSCTFSLQVQDSGHFCSFTYDWPFGQFCFCHRITIQIAKHQNWVQIGAMVAHNKAGIVRYSTFNFQVNTNPWQQIPGPSTTNLHGSSNIRSPKPVSKPDLCNDEACIPYKKKEAEHKTNWFHSVKV